MRRAALIAFCLSLVLTAQARGETELSGPDSAMFRLLDAALVVASPKEEAELRTGGRTESRIAPGENLPQQGGVSLQSLSGYVPNFFMPQYGSVQTGAIYIRGLGSRIGSPAVGLYIDDMPVLEKSTYNSEWLAVRRIDVLRGPQGALYGQNTMGGLVRLHTADPLLEQGLEARLGFSSRDGGEYFSLSGLHKFSGVLGLGADAFYKHNEGVWHNSTTGSRVGGGSSGGAKVKLVWKPGERWRITAQAQYEYIDEEAYPYFYAGALSGEDEGLTTGQILNNREASYRRSLLNSGVSVGYKGKAIEFSSITSYQNLRDRMMMDQDFTSLDIYTLEQVQRSNTVTEELILKGREGGRIGWLAGTFCSWQAMRTKAPVVFYGDGIDMLNSTIAESLPTISYGGVEMPLSAAISEESFAVPGSYRTPSLNGAVYASGTLHDLLPRLDLTLGARLNHEHQELSYRSGGEELAYTFAMQMTGTVDLTSQTGYEGKIESNYTHLLPRVGLTYRLPEERGNVYAVVSKGVRSGGYNIQMFSDIVSYGLRADMMEGARSYCDNLLSTLAENAQSETLAQMYENIREAMNSSFPETEGTDIREAVTYKPEYCWNYELGTHLQHPALPLSADIALFYIDTHDQQIVRFSDGGMGRMMVNTGRSRSLGAELSLSLRALRDRLLVTANYGYTNAKFRTYDAGDGNDYEGNRVPFVPEHTLGLTGDYTIDTHIWSLRSLTVGADLRGYGRIYWTEDNSAWQNFYLVLGAHAMLQFDRVSIDVWGKNLTQTGYRTFYFESLSRGFYQKGMPLQVGVDIRLSISN